MKTAVRSVLPKAGRRRRIMQTTQKKTYEAPQLTMHGAVEELTRYFDDDSGADASCPIT
jgi:hypothetical protein